MNFYYTTLCRRKNTNEEKEIIHSFHNLSEQIKDRNAALLSVQLERVDLKTRLKHAYKYLNEGKRVFSIYVAIVI